MALIVSEDSSSKNYEPLPLGPQQAVCAFVEDIGTHEGSYQGKPIMRRQIVVCWELAEKMTKLDNIGKPFMCSKFYTMSLNEKSTLRHDLNAWRGKDMSEDELKGFDLKTLIGVNCMLNVVEYTKQDGKQSQKIGSIMPPMKNMIKIEPVNTIAPEWISKKRSESVEAREAPATPHNATANGDDLPF